MKLIIASGISGSGRKELLNKWETYCAEKGKHVKVFHIGEMMSRHFKDIGVSINPDNILNVNPIVLQTARSAVLKGILDEITNYPDKYDAVVICIHMWFRWNEIYLDAYDRFLKKFLSEPKSTMFITFIDDFRPILSRLKSREQWQNQKIDARTILSWQNIEVGSTYRLADFADIPFHAVPVEESPSEFYKLVFHPEIEPVYVAMPISHLRNPEDRQPIDRFIERLKKYFVVVNPLSVEVVGAVNFDKGESEKFDLAVHHHIVHRDLYWFMRFCKKIIVYWPEATPPASVRQIPEMLELWPKAVPSPGVDHETHEAFGEGKDVWVVFLGGETSPFLVHYNTKLFLGEEEFFAFLAEKYPERA
jgi:adenylate kinase